MADFPVFQITSDDFDESIWILTSKQVLTCHTAGHTFMATVDGEGNPSASTDNLEILDAILMYLQLNFI